MKLSMWQLDAFSRRTFAGNPAAVVTLTAWLPDRTLLDVAAENNLAETAYLAREANDYRVRWFTPTMEIPLCGHATLASAWVVFNRLEPGRKRVVFESLSGPLPVDAVDDKLVLDFPANTLEPASDGAAVIAALGRQPQELYSGWQWLALYGTEEEVRDLRPDMAALVATGVHAVIATAKGRDADFVSRFFAPTAGVPEDHVTGSAHTRLTPFWAKKLGKTRLYAQQLSARGGELWCELLADGTRVGIAGHAALFLEGMIEV
jgi:PhzF family phenazine biosynthesis protein